MAQDELRAEAERLRAGGLGQRAIAAELGTSQSTVGRILRGERHLEPVAGAVTTALRRYLAALELDPAEDVLAAAALALAARVDSCASSDTTAAARALPRLALALVELLSRIAKAESGRPSREVVGLLREIRG